MTYVKSSKRPCADVLPVRRRRPDEHVDRVLLSFIDERGNGSPRYVVEAAADERKAG
jgi:hypothetical protein